MATCCSCPVYWLEGVTDHSIAPVVVFPMEFGMPSSFARIPALRDAVHAILWPPVAHSPRQYAFQYERILGTSLELQVVASNADAAGRAEAAVLTEVDRLAGILSGYSPTSEFSRWEVRCREFAPVSPELADVLSAAEAWRMTTDGAFNPAAASLAELIGDGTHRQARLAERECSLHRAVQEHLHAMEQPLWTVNRTRGVAYRLTDLPASLDAIAKGYIIDRALARAREIDGITQLLLNIGGDLRHHGARPITVRVTDPEVPAENAPPIATVRLSGEALATSGGYRRGFVMDGQSVSHIIDPRSGRPASRVISASVIAPDCMTADALSTAFSVLTPAESVALADSLPNVGCMMVERGGRMTSNSTWQNHRDP